MSEMIERVAEALYYHEAGSNTGGWKGPLLAERGREMYRKQARAALEAMREHSPEQEKRMNVVLGQNTPATRRWHWVWYEMIDAALNPGTADEAKNVADAT